MNERIALKGGHGWRTAEERKQITTRTAEHMRNGLLGRKLGAPHASHKKLSKERRATPVEKNTNA
jgi:hypothetical protein